MIACLLVAACGPLPQPFSRDGDVDNPLLAPLLDLIRSDEARLAVDALGGYETSCMGEVVAEVGGG